MNILEPKEISTATSGDSKEAIAHPFQSLRELIDLVSGKNLPVTVDESEKGIRTEALPFPFLAISFLV